ncbi:MAG: pteridine-dependent deoxygenase [Rhodanobacter sp.]
MFPGRENPRADPLARRAPQVAYRMLDLPRALAADGTLAVFGFGAASGASDDPRWLPVALEPLQQPAPLEIWQVDAPVLCGRSDALQWSTGGGWLFAAIEVDEREHGGPGPAAEHAYTQLRQFVATRAEHHVLRLWNYLADINHGAGDAERYKQFCDGRARGMASFFGDGFPAASALGHHGRQHLLQVYLLACDQAGTRVENPRQVSAWRYPRQYGRTPPSFARAMALPAFDSLAISGTAAVVGHASAHEDDLDAQLAETLINIDALLASAGMPVELGAHCPLKVYLRHAADLEHVRERLQRRLPGVPLLFLHGDVCRSELLVEIDGWRYA